MAARRAEAAERQARGELDPVREASRMRLREVIARQRDLGLLREAGTADLLAEAGLDPGGASGSGFRGGRGRRGRFGREPGAPTCLTSTYIESVQAVAEFFVGPASQGCEILCWKKGIPLWCIAVGLFILYQAGGVMDAGPGRGARGRGRSSFDGGRKRWAEDGQPPPESGALPSQKRAKVEGAEDPPHTEGLEVPTSPHQSMHSQLDL